MSAAAKSQMTPLAKKRMNKQVEDMMENIERDFAAIHRYVMANSDKLDLSQMGVLVYQEKFLKAQFRQIRFTLDGLISDTEAAYSKAIETIEAQS